MNSVPKYIVTDFIVTVAQVVAHSRDKFPLNSGIPFAQFEGLALYGFPQDFHRPLEGEEACQSATKTGRVLPSQMACACRT